ncbi:MAG: GIY-YIG nuclease family protein [bacterium]
MKWYLYILQCNDRSLYTGITTDIKRRFKEHVSGKGGRFTRSHKPKNILYTEKHPNRSKASKREAEIKSWPRIKKLALVKRGLNKKNAA